MCEEGVLHYVELDAFLEACAAELYGLACIESGNVSNVEIRVLSELSRDCFNNLIFNFFLHNESPFYSALPLVNALTSILSAGLMVVQIVDPFR